MTKSSEFRITPTLKVLTSQSIESIKSLENLSQDRDLLDYYGYSLGPKISQGAYATVLKAKQKNGKFSMLIAAKVVDNKDKMTDKKLYPRGESLWNGIRHSHIIKVYDIINVNERIYTFMELARNGSISDFLLKYGPVDEERAKRWTKGLFEALNYLHRKGVPHRHLECNKLLLDHHYEVKVGDFGYFKRVFTEEGVEVNMSLCGRAAYIPPEMLNEDHYDIKKADVWSAGICVYEMLNNMLPFRDDDKKSLYFDQVLRRWDHRPEVKRQLSLPAIQTIRHMLEPFVYRRATLNQILGSSWLKS